MKVFIDWNNPEEREKVRLEQKQLREQIRGRWKLLDALMV